MNNINDHILKSPSGNETVRMFLGFISNPLRWSKAFIASVILYIRIKASDLSFKIVICPKGENV
jgi:hypothetical protein